MMVNKLEYQQLKDRYQSLLIEDKRKVGEALVKINLGLAMPEELRLVATFLKGTSIVARKGGFDELIIFLNNNESARMKKAMGEKTEVDLPVMSDNDFLKNFSFHREDEEDTVKVHQQTIEDAE